VHYGYSKVNGPAGNAGCQPAGPCKNLSVRAGSPRSQVAPLRQSKSLRKRSRAAGLGSVAPNQSKGPRGTFRLSRSRHRSHRPNRVRFRYGRGIHLRLLPTSPFSDAVIFGYRPESVCLKRTFISLFKHAFRRTSAGLQAGCRVGVHARANACRARTGVRTDSRPGGRRYTGRAKFLALWTRRPAGASLRMTILGYFELSILPVSDNGLPARNWLLSPDPAAWKHAMPPRSGGQSHSRG
jgi:hypothetical protein